MKPYIPWNYFGILFWYIIKVQPCKLYYCNKYMIALIQITNTGILVFIAVLVFKLLNPKVLFRNRRDKRNC